MNRKLRKASLPGGLLAAAAVAMLWPIPGQVFKALHPTPYLIAIIFAVNGYSLDFKDAELDRKFPLVALSAAAWTLLAGPLLGSMVVGVLPLSVALGSGLLVMSAMPSTLSACVVMTEIRGGNTVWALSLTSVVNMLGMLAAPMTLGLCLGKIEGESVAVLPLLLKLLKIVLTPLLIGMALRTIVKKRPAPPLTMLPTICVVLVAWGAFSASGDILSRLTIGDTLLLLAGIIMVHGALMIGAHFMRFPLRLRNREATAVLFVGSQKTLPMALGVLAALPPSLAGGMVACLIFHFTQLIFDSFVVSKVD